MSDNGTITTRVADDDRAAESLAQRRFFTMQAARLLGVALLLFAILVVHGGIALPSVVGYVLAPIGLVLFAVVPIVLARRWRSARR